MPHFHFVAARYYQRPAIPSLLGTMTANEALIVDKLRLPNHVAEGVKQLTIALLYVSSGYVIHYNFPDENAASTVWWGNGLSLAVALLGGRRYFWGIFLGVLSYNAMVKDSVAGAISTSLASLVEVSVGFELLARNSKFSPSLTALSDYLRLMLWGGGVASIAGAFIGVFSLQIVGIISSVNFWEYASLWWMGDTLGIVLAAPFIMVWWRKKSERLDLRKLLEESLLIGITFVAGQIIFLGWFNDNLVFVPKAFMMFLFITWIAIRLGMHATTFTLNMIAVQALSGVYLKVGYFADETVPWRLHNYWTYMVVLSLIGIAVAAYVNDIKRKEKNLRDSESHLRLCQVNGGIGTWEANLLTHKEKWSDSCISMLGFPDLKEPTWEDFLEAVHPEDRSRVIEAVQSHIELGSRLEVEYRIVTREGIRWMRSAGQAERGPDGRLAIMRGVVQEVSERIQAEEALRESETLLRESQMIAGLGSYALDIATGFWKSSPILDRIFGIDQAYEHSVAGWLRLIHDEDLKRIEDYFKNDVLAQGEIFDKEYRVIRREDRAVRWVHGLGKLEFDAQGRPVKMHGTVQDITERKTIEESLRQNEERLRAYLDNISDTIWLIDPDLNVAYVSPNVERFLGFPPDELIGRPSALVIHPDDMAIVDNAHRYTLEHAGQPHTVQYRVSHKQGRWIYVESTGINLLDNREIKGVLVSMRNITERKQAENDLRIAATAFESQEGMFITDAHSVILQVNGAFTAITGYTAEEAVGKKPDLLKSGRQDAEFYAGMWKSLLQTGAWQGEIWNRRKNGEIYPQHLTITAVKDAGDVITNYVATLTDITLQKAAADKIERLALYDGLTGLPNRQLLRDRLISALASSNRSGRKGALLFIDLDNFKTLNDTLGHDMGDALLQQVAQRLEDCVREGDTVARLGGDEFVVMLEDLSEQAFESAAQTEAIGDKILDSLTQPYSLAMQEYYSTSSIGATVFSGHEQSIDELLKQADIAMYQAKTSGRNALRFFDLQMQDRINARVRMEADLRLALSENQFKLYYQPQVCHDNRILGAEALIRWQHPLYGLVPPADFIPLAEETGLIIPLGRWVLETACAQIKAWENNALYCHLQIAVNVSARQFRQADFADQVCRILRCTEINPDRLKLELTESLLLDDINDCIRKMNALREAGVFFSMDDFGTGHSSLAYLTQLPLDQLKIDKSFIHNIGEKEADAVIVQTIIGMSKNLGMKVIAEGVETESQRAFLEQLDCPIYQGYLFSKPLPVEQFESLFD
jgi:diguanylate cyclase (GGDEF)-like protein/PAS domain S-box-containing protein